MGRKPSLTLTAAELRIMRVLWERGEATNADVVDAIKKPVLARNTIMTTLSVLERKGFVGHRVDGRTFVYRALVAERTARGTALDAVLRGFFGGSAETLVSTLLESERISPADRRRIQELLGETEK